MSFNIAFAGKGGSGKTNLSALTINYLVSQNKIPVLAVDADPNYCLNESLGVPIHSTIGTIRETSLNTKRASAERQNSLTLEETLNYKIQQSIVESEGFDLIVMGRPEGEGCYCAANNIIKKCSERLSKNYPYIVIDNEAGLEHLSRKTTDKIDFLIIVSEPSLKGIITAKRIQGLTAELHLEIKKSFLIINKIIGNGEQLKAIAKNLGLDIAGILLFDNTIEKLEIEEKDIFHFAKQTILAGEFFKILDSLEIP